MDLLKAAGANTTRAVQLTIIKSLLLVVDRIVPVLLTDFVPEANRIVAPSLDVANYSALRIESFKVLIALLKKVRQLDNCAQLMDILRQVFTLRVEEFLRDTSPEVKSRADEAKRLMATD